MKKILIVTLVCIYLIQGIFFMSKIIKNRIIDVPQKIINSILVFLLPFIWYYTIKNIFDDRFTIMTKKERDYLQKREPSSHSNSGGV